MRASGTPLGSLGIFPHSKGRVSWKKQEARGGREFFIDNLLIQNHFIIVMIRWTGLAPWVFEFPFPGSLISTFPAFTFIS